MARKKDGCVYTRPWVVKLVLDVCGFLATKDLAQCFAIEPACGEGAFACEMVSRLMESCIKFGHPFESAINSLRLIDKSQESIAVLSKKLDAIFTKFQVSETTKSELLEAWLITDDYILMEHYQNVDFVVGNPPYIRSNDIPECLKESYLSQCDTMTPGSDLFIGFIEVGLKSLAPDGVLSYICADRWTHNAYGKPLRKLISENYSLDSLIVMHDVQAFETDVSAYPAIATISNKTQQNALLAFANEKFSEGNCSQLLYDFSLGTNGLVRKHATYEVGTLPASDIGETSWPIIAPQKLETLKYIEGKFLPLEETAPETRVGIGIATGNDKVFLIDNPSYVEDEIAVPIMTSKQLSQGLTQETTLWLVNPWSDNGRLVDLAQYPKTKKYLELNREQLTQRSIAQKNPENWYRTIDRFAAGLLNTPKLLIQDMHHRLEPYFDESHYPHGNLYYIVSKGWDLKVLGGLLMSDICELFIDAYGVKMRGGTLRFQAQFLRKICLPCPNDIEPAVKRALRKAFESKNYEAANKASKLAFGISGSA